MKTYMINITTTVEANSHEEAALLVACSSTFTCHVEEYDDAASDVHVIRVGDVGQGGVILEAFVQKKRLHVSQE